MDTKLTTLILVGAAAGGAGLESSCYAADYPIVDTRQERSYDNSREVAYPKSGQAFFGQDAQYNGNQPSYQDNKDGTITDLVTRLMWQQNPGAKKTYQQAAAGASACRVGGHDDWRLPTIKELYSLILFNGIDPDQRSNDPSKLKPFIDTTYFKFQYGNTDRGERIIDSQFATSTKYVSTTMRGNETLFGVNFADGRIKGYPINHPGRRRRGAKVYYVLYVRDNKGYGKNAYKDNGDSTVTDRATGLTWMKVDSGHLKAGQNKDGKLNWEQALKWAEDLEYAGHSDWRLPNIKELQSIVDYSRSPDTTQSAAIDHVFSVTPIRDAQGKINYPFYWSGTTHVRGYGGAAAAYVAFGRSQGWMSDFRGRYNLLDVHGAGSQRSDPKAGDPSRYPRGRGPQGDVINIYNFVRPVRGGNVSVRENGPELASLPPRGRSTASGSRGRRDRNVRDRGAGGFGGSQGGGRSAFDPDAFVDRIYMNDKNGDGKVSREEMPERMRQLLDLGDDNNDNAISRREAESIFRRMSQRDPRRDRERGQERRRESRGSSGRGVRSERKRQIRFE
jgi:hypothetical protein